LARRAASSSKVRLLQCVSPRAASLRVVTPSRAPTWKLLQLFSKPLLTEARHFPTAEERQEDLKLLESTASVEDGKPAKMLVPKAIDADDADSGSDDDSDDDDESVSVAPNHRCCSLLHIPSFSQRIKLAAVMKTSQQHTHAGARHSC
jgi:hypothetical protein